MKNVIGITGCSGILGSELKKKIKKKIYCFKDDITNRKEVFNWVKNNNFSSIFHFAALVPVDEVNKNKKLAYKTNYIGTKNLVDAIIKYNKKIWFFYASTSHVYGTTKSPIKILEISKCRPENYYGLTKLLAEKYLIHNDSYINYCIGRIFSFTHKNQKKNFFIPSVLNKFINSKIPIFKNVNHYRDFLSTSDIIRGIIYLNKKKARGIYNIGSGKKIHLVKIIKEFNKKFKKEIKLNLNKKSTYLVSNINKLKNLGWEPKIDFLSKIIKKNTKINHND